MFLLHNFNIFSFCW